jgi:mRNA interferase MazF
MDALGVEMGVKRGPRRGDVVFVADRPAVGGEIRKARPWLVVSPDELNASLATVTVAPLSTGSHPHPYRGPCAGRGTRGHVIVDQVSTLDRARIDRIAGAMSSETVRRVLATLREMFEE